MQSFILFYSFLNCSWAKPILFPKKKQQNKKKKKKALSYTLPTPAKFPGHIPIVFNVAIISSHIYFGEAHILGMPNTGGQVSLWLHLMWKS
jgi:hypothetical protein